MQPMRPVHGGTPVPPRNPLKWRTLAFLLAWLLLTLTLMAINGAGWPLILGVGVLAAVARRAGGGHPSRRAVASTLARPGASTRMHRADAPRPPQRPTRELGRATLERSLSGL